uniref:Uncharacterized protein n=1 Tax=Romanomermis culicivorax TaxID=13658 RepID=A0A915KDC1_ROMCU
MEIISFDRLVPISFLRYVPVLWQCSAILCLLGLIFQLINAFLANRRSPLDYTCIFSWIAISTLHIVDYKSQFAQKIGLFKDDLFTLQIFFSTCLSLASIGYFALSFRRQKYCSRNNRNRKCKNTRSIDAVSNCYSFTSSVCSSCNRSTGGKSVRRRAANTSMDDQSPSRLLGSKLSSLSLGGGQSLSPAKRSDAGSCKALFAYCNSLSSHRPSRKRQACALIR